MSYKVLVFGKECVGKNTFCNLNKYDIYLRCTDQLPEDLSNIDGIILMYDITDLSSFEYLLENIESSLHIPTIVIGTKFDLEVQRKVTTYYGKTFIRNGISTYFDEICTKHEGFLKTYDNLISEIDASKNKPINKKRIKCIIM